MLKKLICFLILLFLSNSVFAGVSFDGGGTADDQLTCGTNDVITETSPLTVSFWINLTGTGEGLSGRIIDRTTVLIFHDGTNDRGFALQINGTTSGIKRTVDDLIVAGTWQHWLVTWDGGDAHANIHWYLNGTETSYGTNVNRVTATDNSAATFYIGNNGANTRTWNGSIDEIAVWNIELNAQEINILSQSRVKRIPLQIRPSSLQYYFALDEQEGGTASNVTYENLASAGNSDCTGVNSPTGISEAVLSYP